MKTYLCLLLIVVITFWLSDRAFQDEVMMDLMKTEQQQQSRCYIVEQHDGMYWKRCRIVTVRM